MPDARSDILRVGGAWGGRAVKAAEVIGACALRHVAAHRSTVVAADRTLETSAALVRRHHVAESVRLGVMVDLGRPHRADVMQKHLLAHETLCEGAEHRRRQRATSAVDFRAKRAYVLGLLRVRLRVNLLEFPCRRPTLANSLAPPPRGAHRRPRRPRAAGVARRACGRTFLLALVRGRFSSVRVQLSPLPPALVGGEQPCPPRSIRSFRPPCGY